MAARMERFNSGGTSISVEVFLPTAAGRHPAALILHGTFGLLPQYRPDIVAFAEALADKGTVAVVPHYFDRTGTAPGLDAGAAIPRHLEEWKAACGDALAFARGHASVDPGRLGVIGFSLGGHLALDLAMSPRSGTGLKCVVDFFAPTRVPPLRGDRSLLPPVLIHHGTGDTLVPIADSLGLVSDLRAAGKVEGLGYRFVKYPGQGHGFTGSDLAGSRSTTVDFVAGIV
jgi:carboxymethylenebutenolidase